MNPARVAWRTGLLTAAAVTGLVADAWVHAHLAADYSGVRAAISQATLFRLEAGLALLAAMGILFFRGRVRWLAGFAVAAGGLALLLLYRYVDVGKIGPLPNMFEPSWYPEKAVSAVAEGVAALACLLAGRQAQPVPGRRVGGRAALARGLLGLAAVAAVGAGAGSAAHQARQATFAGAARDQQVRIVGNDMLRFVPALVHVHTGAVIITLVDSGAYPHNLVIPGLAVTSASVTGDPGGQRVSFLVTFRHPGRYQFYCQYHRSAGMSGTFEVTG